MDRLADALNGDSGDQIDPATGDVVAGRLAAADDHSIQLTLVMPSDWLPVRVCMVVLLGRDRLPRGGAMDHGSMYRRCGCREEATGRLLGARCPGLSSSQHGSWYFSADLPSASGERRRVRRGGFATQEAAAAALGSCSVTGEARSPG